MLAARNPFSFDDSVALQRDTFSPRAAALRGLLNRVRAPDLAADVAMLRAWDGHVDAASEAAELLQVLLGGIADGHGRAADPAAG